MGRGDSSRGGENVEVIKGRKWSCRAKGKEIHICENELMIFIVNDLTNIHMKYDNPKDCLKFLPSFNGNWDD